MTLRLPFALMASLGLALSVAACDSGSTPAEEKAQAARLASAAQPAERPAPAAVAQEPAVPLTAHPAAEPQAASAQKGKPRGRTRPDQAFGGSREDMQTLIGYHHSVRLTPEQERVKVEALSTLPAPCCSQYSLATCCCPCNMAKAAWGMAAWLIAEKGYDAEQVRQAEKDWLQRVNPGGFSGNACTAGGCGRAMHQDGCGGMQEEALAL